MDIFNTTSPFSPESDASQHHHHHHHHHHHSRPPSPHTAPAEAVEESACSESSRSQSPGSSTNDTSDNESPSPPPDSPTDDSTQADSNGNSRITWNSLSGHPKHYAPSDSDQVSKTRRKLLHMRGYDDQDETDWWFASTACPLLAATIAPLANVLSIAALVTFWRMDVQDFSQPSPTVVPDFEGVPYKDPRW
jgi:hypothetical protein